MAAMSDLISSGRIGHALKHRLRRRIIEALWRSSHPLSAQRFHDEFVHDRHVTLAMVVYHARQLNRDGIVEVDVEAGDFERRPFVLSGPNCAEAIRRLQLSGDLGGGA
jgi:hypothetical protein